MNLTLNNNRLRELIPGIIHEVKGETTLYDKISPWIETAKAWLEDNFLGADFDPSAHGLYPLCEKIIVYQAMATAIPALDVVLSPAGYAVINTEGRAPASKERVERLIESMNSSVDANVMALNSALCRIAEWRETPTGKWWCTTLLPTMSEVYRFRRGQPLLEAYRTMRYHALRFERESSDEYLGAGVLAELRNAQHTLSDYDEIITMVREAELRYITFHTSDQKSKCPDEHELWHMLRGVLSKLIYYPELKQIWDEEMGEKFKAEPFKNDIKGGFYF